MDNSLRANIDDVHGGTPHKEVAVSRRPWMVERDQVSRAPRRARSDGSVTTGYVSQGPEATGRQEAIRKGFPGGVSVSREAKRRYFVGRGGGARADGPGGNTRSPQHDQMSFSIEIDPSNGGKQRVLEILCRGRCMLGWHFRACSICSYSSRLK